MTTTNRGDTGGAVFSLTETLAVRHGVTSKMAKDRKQLEVMKNQLQEYLGAAFDSAGDAMRVFHEHQKARKLAERQRFLEAKATNQDLAKRGKAPRRKPPTERSEVTRAVPSFSTSSLSLPALLTPSIPRPVNTARSAAKPSSSPKLPAPPQTARPWATPKPPTSARPAVQHVDELPTLAPGYRAKAYVAERIEMLNTNESLKTQFMDTVHARLRQEVAVNRLMTEARTDMLHAYLEERRDPDAFYHQAAEQRKLHTREVRRRRTETARDQLQTREDARRAATARSELAAKARFEEEESAERAERWSRIVATVYASRVMRRIGDSRLKQMRAVWRRLRVVVVAAWWRGRVRAKLRKRAELRSNVHLGKSLPEALVRVRRRMYLKPTDLLLQFLRDVRHAKHFATTVTHYLRSLRRSQAILRRHLAARSLWHHAMALAWENCVHERILRQFNAVYPRDAVALPGGKRRVDILSPGMPKPQLLADVCITAFVRQEYEQRAAVSAFGLTNLTDSTVAPSAKKNKDASKFGKEDVLLAYVPASLRLRVIKEVTSALSYQRSCRLIAAEERRRSGAPPLIVPKLNRFIDKRSITKLVTLVETKLAQSRAAALLEAQLVLRAAELAAAADASKSFASLTRGAVDDSSSEAKDEVLALSATAAFEEEQMQQALAEAALYAPDAADTPHKSDARIAGDILLTIVSGHALGIPLTSPTSPSAFESVMSRSVSPTQQSSRRKRIMESDSSAAAATSSGDRRAALHIAMPMKDAAEELMQLAVNTMIPSHVTFAVRFAKDY